MDIKLRDYQVDCIEKVFDRLSEGARHLSVVMTTGLGKNITSLLLAKQVISTKNAKIAMVFGTKTLLLQAQTTSEKLEITNIVFFSVSEFLINTTEYKYVFLYDLSAFDRRQIKECIKDKDIITISFSAPFLEIRDSGKKEIYVSKPGLEPVVEEMVIMPKTHYLKKSKDYGTDYYKLPSPLVCVYVTKEVIDIRDAKYAGYTENLYVKRENEKIFNWLHQQNVQVNIEIHEVKKHNKHLMAYMEALNQAKLQPKSKELVEKSERLKALLPEDERDKTIEELKARLEEREKQLREKDAIIAQQDQMIAFQQDILSGFGIDSSIIHDSFEQIQLVRASLKNDLENSNDTVKEIALKQLQDKVADIVSRLTQSALSTNDQEYFEEYLVGQLSEEVWNRLDDKSKSFLITAKSNYESMIKLKDGASFDYSGVCLLVTKALEVETTKRFFLFYKDYLSKKYNSVSQWPDALRQRNRGMVTGNVISDNEFTLGSVVSVLGYKRVYDAYRNIIAYTTANRTARMEFLDYAQNHLFKFSEHSKVERELEKDYRFIEKVRLDYRNPSAHKDRLTITSAKNCLEYVIDVQHMLREMLITMKI